MAGSSTIAASGRAASTRWTPTSPGSRKEKAMTAQADARQPADDELLITRVFDAPLPLVFLIWEERDHMMRWLGPKDFTCTSLDLDFRPGGTWRACIESDAYGQSWMGGQFREIEKDRRIVYTFAWEDGRDQPGIETL